MSDTIRKRSLIGAFALVAAVGPLAACGSDDSASDDTTPESAESETAEASESPAADEAAAGEFKAPAWAKPSFATGTKLTTVKAGDISVDVYKAGTAEATEDGNFVDPETKKPILAKGDELVFVNYIITNKGSSPIDLDEDDVEIDSKWDNWPYLQGMDGVTDDELYTKFKINGGDESDMADFAKYDPEDPQPLAPGETVSYGDNFAFEKGHELKLEVEVGDADPVESSVKVS